MSSASYYSSGYRPDPVGGINPVLVQLYHAHGIRPSSIEQMREEERLSLCASVSDLIEQTNLSADREMAADILLSLLRHAEKNLRQAIAERFSTLESAPLRLILQFVNDEIEVARPVLVNSPVLNDLDLIYIIQSRQSPFWQAIANRKQLGENVIETLVDTGDSVTAQVLVANEAVMLSDYAVRQLISMAKEHSELGEALLARQGLSADLVRHIYQAVGQSMVTANSQLCPVEQQALGDVLAEFTEQPSNPFLPNAPMLKAADLFKEQGRLSKTLMLNTLRRGQMASFVAQYARYTDLPVAVVIPMLQQKNGQGLAIAAKAYGFECEDYLVIFNTIRKIMGEVALTPHEINSAANYFNRITPAVAKRLMKRNTH
jgi:uncharacterized protein (DUF2336 family)